MTCKRVTINGMTVMLCSNIAGGYPMKTCPMYASLRLAVQTASYPKGAGACVTCADREACAEAARKGKR